MRIQLREVVLQERVVDGVCAREIIEMMIRIYPWQEEILEIMIGI